MSLVIRHATAADIVPLGIVGHAAWCQGLRPLLPPSVHHKVTPADFEELVRELPHETLIAELDGVPVGLAATELGDDEISDVWVSPAHAGRGLGRALLDAATAVVRERGFEAVRLQVLGGNERAFRLYERNGFAIAWQGRQYDPLLEIDVDKIHMSKPLRLESVRSG